MNYIDLNNVNYKNILNDFNLVISSKMNISLIGPSGSGKTTLLRILAGDYLTKCDVSFNGLKIDLSNILNIKKDISLVLNDNNYVEDIVIDELKHLVTNLVLKPDEVDERVSRVINYFELHGILDNKIEDLRTSDKILIKILMNILIYPKVVIIDELIDYLVKEDVVKLFKFLDELDINYIYSTADLDNTLYSQYIICLYNGKVAIEGNTISVLKEEKLLKRLGFLLPFYIDLSIQLGYYELIDNVYLNKEELAGALWE